MCRSRKIHSMRIRRPLALIPNQICIEINLNYNLSTQIAPLIFEFDLTVRDNYFTFLYRDEFQTESRQFHKNIHCFHLTGYKRYQLNKMCMTYFRAKQLYISSNEISKLYFIRMHRNDIPGFCVLLHIEFNYVWSIHENTLHASQKS